MIIRKQAIKQSSEEVSLQVSFTLADISRWMKMYYSLVATPCGHSFALALPINEQSALQYFGNEAFSGFPQKYREQLAAWAFAMARRHGFLIQSQDPFLADNIFFLSDKASKKAGRPRIEDDD